MTGLKLADSNRIIEAAFARAGELGLKPLGVAVLDAGGHLLAFQRQDGASFMRHEIAAGKAFGALAIGMGSRALGRIATDRPHFFTGLSGVSGGRIVPVPGGVLIRDGGGGIVGAVGVSGDTSDQDEACAVAGIRAAGFHADAG
ncbi:MAG TPA: heme-binding protein [Rhizobiales bacterium]|nr:heme-binding protein [Hyphomicrobiales bacterium]